VTAIRRHTATKWVLPIRRDTKPWWEPITTPPMSASPLLQIHTQGWRHGIWHDGPTIFWLGGRPLMVVPPGVAFRCTFPILLVRSTPENPPILQSQVNAYGVPVDYGQYRESWRKVFLHVMDARLGDGEGIRLEVRDFDLPEAVLAVMLRACFPNHPIALSHLPNDGQRGPLWRRLSRHLGFYAGKRPVPQNVVWRTLPLEAARGMVPPWEARRMAAWWNRRGHVIPPAMLSGE